MSKTFYLKDCYICNYCKNICKGPCNDLKEKINSGELKPGMKEYEDNIDLATDRKQIIDCLGPLCDKPCKFRKKECTVSKETLAKTILFLGEKLNSELIKNK